MTDLTPAASFDDVVQLETTDRALGGTGNPMNRQAQALLNRTQFLRNAQIVLQQFDTDLGTDGDPAKGVGKVAGAQRTVMTISALAALGAGVTSVNVLHRTSIADAAGGMFDWVAGDQSASVTADPLQGVWVAPDSDPTGASGAYRRSYIELDVQFFGALEGGGSDCTAAIQAAIDYAPSFSSIRVPDGVWLVTDTIRVNRGQVRLRGAGMGVTVLRRTDGAYGDTILVAHPTPVTDSLFDVEVSGFRIESTVLMTSGAHLHLQEIGGCWFNDLRLLNGFKGIYCQGVRTTMVRNTLIQAGTHTASVQPGSAYVHIGLPVNPASETTELFFSDFNWEFTGNPRTMENGLLIEECDGVWFNNGHIFSADTATCHLRSNVSATQLIGTTFNNVWFDQLSDRNLQVSGTGPLFGNHTFNCCRFWGGDNYQVLVSASTTVQDMEFNGCEFGKSNASQAIDIFAGNTLSFSGCKFEQINQDSGTAAAAYLIVRASSTLSALNVKACTVKGDDKLQHGFSLLNSSCKYGISANEFTNFALSTGSEINVSVTGDEIVGQISGNTTDRTFSVATASTITVPAIATTVNITGGAGTIDTIIPKWEGRDLTVRADTAVQTLSEAGNIVTAVAGSFAIQPTRATNLKYFSAFDDWCQV